MYFKAKFRLQNHVLAPSFTASSVSLLAFSLLSGCVPPTNSAQVGGKSSSRLSSVQMNMPAVGSLKTTDGQTPVTGVRVSIKPTDPASCTKGSSIEQVLQIDGMPAIQQKIIKGCDYDLRVELGKFEESGNGFNLQNLGAIYYAPSQATKITADQTQEDRIAVRVSLALTDEGRRIGLPEALPVPSPSPQPEPQPEPQPTPQPAPQPQPTPQPSNLPASLNVTMKGNNGNVGLPSIFTTPYLIVDFARPGCGPCVSLAKRLDQDATFQRMMNGSKCRFVTLVPTGQLEDWIDAAGGSHAASSSYEYTHSKFATAVGTSVTATPTVILIDRSGKVVDKSVGGMPSKLQSLCGGN